MSASDLHPVTAPRRSIVVPGPVLLLAVAGLAWVGRERVRTDGNIDYGAYHLTGLKVRLGLSREILYPHPAADGRPASSAWIPGVGLVPGVASRSGAGRCSSCWLGVRTVSHA
jgi:hypothetical protein